MNKNANSPIRLATRQRNSESALKNIGQATVWFTAHVSELVQTAEARGQSADDGLTNGGDRTAMLRDASVHLDVAAAIYRLLLEHADSSTVSLSDCLARTVAAALEPLGLRQRCSFEFSCEPGCPIPSAAALPVAAITLETIINALHHAHPSGVLGHLSIACHREREFIVLEVGDDGIGMPEAFDLDRDAGIGLRSVIAMAERIDAKVAVESRPLGLTFRLRMRAVSSLHSVAAA